MRTGAATTGVRRRRRERRRVSDAHREGLAKHPIGVILLARLAIGRGEPGTGLGMRLAMDGF
jgi:hypothetical protein